MTVRNRPTMLNTRGHTMKTYLTNTVTALALALGLVAPGTRGAMAQDSQHLTMGQAENAVLEPDAQSAIWTFDAAANQIVSIGVTSDAFDPVVELLQLRSAGQGEAPRRQTGDDVIIAQDDDGGPGTNSLLVHTLPEAGRYRLRVRAYSGAEGAGQYIVEVSTLSPTALDLDTRVAGTLDSGVAVWTLDGTPGQILHFAVDSDAFSTTVQLWSPDGTLLVSTDFVDMLDRDPDAVLSDDRDQFVVALPLAGLYHVRVTAVDAGAEYSFTARTVNPKALSTRSEEGELRRDGPPVDVWAIDAPAGRMLSVAGTSDDFDAALQFRSPSGELLVHDAAGARGSGALLTVIPPSVAGPHQLWVTAADAGSGSYTVAVSDAPAPPSGDGVWSFDGIAGQVVLVTAGSHAFDTVVQLHSPDGDALAHDDDSGPETDSRLVAPLPVTGRYHVSVTSLTGSTGPYDVAVHALTATALPVDTPAAGVLDAAPVGIWEFDGVAGQTVQVEVNATDFDTTVELRAPAGESIARDDDGAGDGSTNSRLVASLPVTGRYQVWVTPFADGDGSYEIRVTTVALPLTLLPLNAPRPASGELLAGVPAADWAFDGAPGQVIRVTAGSAEFDPVVHLLLPSGVELARDDDSGPGTDARLLATLPIAGRYRVRVAALAGGTGPYHVAATIIAAPVLPLGAPTPSTLD